MINNAESRKYSFLYIENCTMQIWEVLKSVHDSFKGRVCYKHGERCLFIFTPWQTFLLFVNYSGEQPNTISVVDVLGREVASYDMEQPYMAEFIIDDLERVLDI